MLDELKLERTRPYRDQHEHDGGPTERFASIG
jgi:hypothetical protein